MWTFSTWVLRVWPASPSLKAQCGTCFINIHQMALLVLHGSLGRVMWTRPDCRKHDGMNQMPLLIYTVSQKNEPILATCSFVKHGLILIILQKQHWRHLLMKASDRGRNVKFLGNNFGCVLSKLSNSIGTLSKIICIFNFPCRFTFAYFIYI